MAGKAKSKPDGGGGEADEPFEASLARLESLVDEMEGDSLPLDQLLKHYEEGMHLAKVCSRKLDEAGKRIEIITKMSEDAVETEEFEGSAGEAGDQDAGENDASLF